MNTRSFIKTLGIGLALSSALALTADEASKTIELDIDSDKELITIQNLAGTITITPSKDSALHIRGLVIADADSDKKATELLEAIEFDTDTKSGQTIISVVYPVDEYTGFLYQPNKQNAYWGNNSTNTRYMGERVRVASKAKGLFSNWANVHTDLTIEMPEEQLSKIKLIAGSIEANDLNNNITLDTGSGRISVLNSQGELLADTGSGRVRVENFSGQVNADTGSGSIELTNIKGNIDADTGSGGIEINKVTGRVKADTGSGSVKIHNFLGGDQLKVDTGSGSVRVNGDLGNLENLIIDTGSGGVTLVTTHAPSLQIEVDTGSGGIDIDLPDMDIKRDKRGDFEADIGSGKGRAEIDTGSGGVTFRMDDSYQGKTGYEKSETQTQQSASTRDKEVHEGKANPELAAKIRAALDADKNIRKANLEISAVGDRAIIRGTMDSIWDIAKAVKIVNGVDGVEKATIDLNLEDED